MPKHACLQAELSLEGSRQAICKMESRLGLILGGGQGREGDREGGEGRGGEGREGREGGREGGRVKALKVVSGRSGATRNQP